MPTLPLAAHAELPGSSRRAGQRLARRLGSLLLIGIAIAAPRLWAQSLPVPLLVELEQSRRGNPLAAYVRLVELEREYRSAPQFADIYDQIVLMHEEFLGIPDAGLRTMSRIPQLRATFPPGETPIDPAMEPRDAVAVIGELAARTRVVIWGEEHHLPQTRSLYEPLLRRLWGLGYRYLAAETFTESVMEPGWRFPTHESGVYLRDPIFASAMRTAVDLGYRLVAYEETAPAPAGDPSFRDRRQAERLNARIFEVDSQARVLVLAGRGHAAETAASDGWTPMAAELKRITGIDPLTVFAVRMSERLTREEEDPRYRFATAHGLVSIPTIFVDRASGRTLGDGSFDAFVFWPRTKLVGGRPDWLASVLGRHPWWIPALLGAGRDVRLVQAFRVGEPDTATPVDQVLVREDDRATDLRLPPGRYRVRAIDRAGEVLGEWVISVP